MFKIAPQTVLVGPDDSPPSKFHFYTDEQNAAISCLKIKDGGGVTKLKFNTGGQLVSQSYQTYQTHEEIEEAKKAKLEGPQPAQEDYPAAPAQPAPSYAPQAPSPPWPPQTQPNPAAAGVVNKSGQFYP